MRGDEQIVGANQGASLREVGPNLCVVAGGITRQVPHHDVRQQRRERHGILHAAR